MHTAVIRVMWEKQAFSGWLPNKQLTIHSFPKQAIAKSLLSARLRQSMPLSLEGSRSSFFLFNVVRFSAAFTAPGLAFCLRAQPATPREGAAARPGPRPDDGDFPPEQNLSFLTSFKKLVV